MCITQACALLGVARATFYRWKAKYETKQLDPIVEKIRQLCEQHKFRYGYRKITALLQREQSINHKRVQRIMQREGLQCRVKIKKRKPTGQPALPAEHLLKRLFQVLDWFFFIFTTISQTADYLYSLHRTIDICAVSSDSKQVWTTAAP